MTVDEFRARVAELVQGRPVKIWLTRSVVHRLDFLWSVGTPQSAQEETLARFGRYYLVGQNVSPDVKASVVKLFEEFCNSDEAKADLEAVKGLKFHRQA